MDAMDIGTENASELPSSIEFSSTRCDVNKSDEELQNSVYKDNPSNAVSKFINGEITFNDYLKQMEDVPDADSTQKIEDTSISEGKPDPVSDNEADQSDSSFSLSEVENEESDDSKEEVKEPKQKKKRIQRSKLSATLRGVMGQANVCYAKGETETAVKMCLEIIKEEPKASEPFRTLASIYEEIGEQEKSLQMRLIAAHLGPAGKDEWLELAHTLKKSNKLRQSVICYTRAINFDVMNLRLYEERAVLMKESGISSKEVYGFLRLLYKLDPEKDGQTLLYLCKKVAKLYYNDKKYDKSCNTLRYAFEKCPNLITNAEVNLFLDVLITIQNFKECLEVMANFCNVEFKTGEKGVIDDCIVPEDIPIDIRAKLIITLLHFDSFHCAKTQIETLLKENAEVMGDLFFDVGMVLVEKQKNEEAIELLEPLTETESFNTITLWFKLASCYKKLNKTAECHRCYERALVCFPDDKDLKLEYCEELKSAQKFKEAVAVTLDDSKSLLIYERCKLYLLLNEIDNFIETGLQLFRLHCKEIRTLEDYRLLLNSMNLVKGLKDLLAPHIPLTVDSSVPLEDEWDIFLKISNIYIERDDYDLLLQLAMNLCLSFKFHPYKKHLRLAVISAAFLNKDYELGFDFFRYIILNKVMDSQKMWNFFNILTQRADYARMHKFLIRYLLKSPKEDNAVMLYANNCLVAGTYKYALNDYALLFEDRETPLLALLIALNMLHITCQKFSSSKHTLVTQVITFLKRYEELRGSDMKQEIYYNIGRAFHQVELLPQAIHYYKEALSCNPPIEDKFNLKCEIAFNLHLIYLNSGQPQIANMYLQKYIVI